MEDTKIDKRDLLKEAGLCQKEENWEELEKITTKILKNDPGNPEALLMRGTAHFHKKDYMDAVNDLRLSLRLNPKNEECRSRLVSLRDLLNQEQDKKVEEELPKHLMDDLGSHGKKAQAMLKLASWSQEVLLRDNVITTLSIELKGTDDAEVLAAGWALMRHIVLDPERISLADLGEKDEKDFAADRMKAKVSKTIDKPIIISDTCEVCRKAVRTNWSAENFLQEFKAIIRGRVEEISMYDHVKEANIPMKRSIACQNMLSVIQCVGDLNSDGYLEAIDMGLSCVESPSIVESAISALGYLADFRRRINASTTALKNSQVLQKCMATLLSLSGENDTTDAGIIATLVALLHMLADKDRAQKDTVNFDHVVDSLLNPYFNQTEEAKQEWVQGLIGLQCALNADRESARVYIDKKNLLPFLVAGAADCSASGDKLRKVAGINLTSAIEFPELRMKLIDASGIEGIVEVLPKLVGPAKYTLAATLSRLCVHDELTRDTIFEKVDFFDILGNILADDSQLNKKNIDGEVALAILEIFFFLSMHAAFKKKIVLKPKVLDYIPTLAEIVKNPQQSPMMRYLFCGLVYNLMRSSEDKEPRERNRKAGDIDLDESQLDQLEEVYKKLPAAAKPLENGKVDLGSLTIAKDLRDQLLNLNIVSTCNTLMANPALYTKNLTKTICRTIRLLSADPSKRGRILSQGGLKALLIGADNQEDSFDEQRHTRQALAQLAITTNPHLFRYEDALDVVPHLSKLLRDEHELYQYEAALGLTNLTSFSDDIRNRCWHGKIWRYFGDLLFSANDMLKAAGLEGWCNMAQSPEVQEGLVKEGVKSDLEIMLAFCGEKGNDRILTATTGALATLAQEDKLALLIVENRNFPVLLQLFKATTNQQVLIRCGVCLDMIEQAEGLDETEKDKIEKLRKTRKID